MIILSNQSKTVICVTILILLTTRYYQYSYSFNIIRQNICCNMYQVQRFTIPITQFTVLGMASSTQVVEKHWTGNFLELLKNIEQPLGSFVYYKQLKNVPSLQPDITIDNVGRIGLPISETGVNELIKVSTKAPYGMQEKTLLDDTIRKAWQIDASMITIESGENMEWSKYFDKCVRRCCYELGISKKRFGTTKIQANLYKMLIYEEGGHFVPHRDTEKEDGMFGTMIIQLPTINGFTGGALSVTHNGKCQTLDLSIDSARKFYEIAFYADCVHELHPITSGKRVCLVYNLVATKLKNSSPSQNVNIETEEKLRAVWANWNGDGKEKICKLGYQLEHKYTYKNFGVSSLKGKDETIFATLKNAKSDTGERLFCVSLLLLEWYHLTVGYSSYDSKETDKYRSLRVIVENPNGSFTVKWDADISKSDDYRNK